MAKNKEKKTVEKAIKSSVFNGEPAANLFIKLVIVIVISSLFLVSLIYIIDRLWSSEPYLPPFNSSMATEILKNKENPVDKGINTPEIIAPEDEPVMCTMEYMPVCAWKNNGMCTGAEDCPRQTYGNTCVANAAHANIISEGECQ
ncbi:MAG TPA: hypothetical protein PLB38_01215 [bacterium]|nr:hypothetical protein [bacterium]